MTKKDLREELKKSMLAKNSQKTSVLRMLLSAIGYYEINKAGVGYEATEEDIMAVIQKEIKQRKDSIEQFKKGGRQDLVDKETVELKILETYLPAQMSEEEISKLVQEIINQTGAQDIGKVMAALMPKVKGKSDGNLVSKIVKENLA